MFFLKFPSKCFSISYGITRSYSLLGSSLSSILSILVLNYFGTKHFQILFLLSILPFFADFLLILSYPPFDQQILKIRENWKKDDHDHEFEFENKESVCFQRNFDF